MKWAVAVLLFAVCGIWILLSQIPVFYVGRSMTIAGPDGLLGFLEEKTIDARLSLRGSISSPTKVAYVNVDTDAIVALGNFPWNRGVFARAIDALFERGHVRAIGMDFVFGSAGIPQLGRKEAEAGSVELGKSILKNQNVVLAATYGTQLGLLGKRNFFPFVFEHNYDPAAADLPELPDFPVVGPTWGHVGLIDTAVEAVRWIPFFAQTEHQTYYPMGLQLFLLTRDLDESALEIARDRMIIRNPAGQEILNVPLTLGQLVEPNWFSPWDENPQVGIFSVLEFDRMAREGDEKEKARAETFFTALNDTVILIGPTDPLLKDMSEAPMSGPHPVPRVSLHGNVFKTLDSGRFLIRPPRWASILLILGLGLGTAALAVVPHRFSRWSKLLSGFVLMGYVGLAFLLFAKAEILLPIVAPLGAAVSCTFLALLRQLSVEEARRRRIKDLFGSYVSATVVDEMIERNVAPTTGGEEVGITAFFSDIVAFSAIAEKLSPKDLVDLMCQYLGECTSAVIDEEGTLDKYVGDAIITIFGAPLACEDHAAAACRAALGLQLAQNRLRTRWVEEKRWPVIVGAMQTRVGLHTGPAIVGNIGSSLRFNYTMMGDTVNLAQRIEAAGSHYGTCVLVSEQTMTAAASADPALVFRKIDRVFVPGRHHPVDLHELLGHGDEARRENEKRISTFDEARSFYEGGLWRAAGEAFRRAAAFERSCATKNPSSVLAARCERMGDGPPAQHFAFPLTKDGNPI